MSRWWSWCVAVAVLRLTACRVAGFGWVTQGTRSLRSVHRCQRLSLVRRTLRRSLVVADADAETETVNGTHAGFDEWTCGNVEDDLRNLQQALTLHNADQEREHVERLYTLRYMAQQRRPVAPDVRRTVLMPLCISFGITSAVAGLVSRASALPALSPMQWFTIRAEKVLTICSDVHFWTVFVVAPLALRVAVATAQSRRAKAPTDATPSDPIAELMERVGPEYSKLVAASPILGGNDLDDPESSCQNFVLCLLEQWTSATAPMLLLVTTLALFGHSRTSSAHLLLLHGNAIRGLYLLAKLGSWASLYQFPKLWFQLSRTNQPQPVTWPVASLQALTNAMWVPWSLIPDTSALWMAWGASPHITAVCASMTLATLALRRPGPTLLSRSSQDRPRVTAKRAVKAMTVLAAMAGALRLWQERPGGNVLGAAAIWIVEPLTGWLKTPDAALRIHRLLTVGIPMIVTAIPPLLHVASWCRLVRVSCCDDVCLADVEDGGRIVDPSYLDATKSGRNIRWRWRLRWREPRRIHTVEQSWRERFVYWFWLQGSVEDKLRRRPKLGPAHQRGLSVWQRVALEHDLDPTKPFSDRREWKSRAMERLAQLHQRDYDAGTFFVSANLV